MTDGQMMGGKFIGVDGASEQDMIDGLDPGIVRLVTWLRANGFNTTDSGDGKTKFAQGFIEDDGVCPFAHVAIFVEPEDLIKESRRLSSLLADEFDIIIEPLGPDPDARPPLIDASYCVSYDTAVIVLQNVDDSMLQ